MMKCYVVEDPNAYEFGLTTVFAETASKARWHCSDELDDEELGCATCPAREFCARVEMQG